MPRGSAPIVPRGSAFRICQRQIHVSRRRAGARISGGIPGGFYVYFQVYFQFLVTVAFSRYYICLGAPPRARRVLPLCEYPLTILTLPPNQKPRISHPDLFLGIYESYSMTVVSSYQIHIRKNPEATNRHFSGL